jgi:2-succinyl-5-enolpyruvyl-6-hydroxy-3-cyclohexene-1-carboxylate synthase
MVVGDLPAPLIRGQQQWLAKLAADLGWPILAEPTANMAAAPTVISHGVLIAGEPGFRDAHAPDVVITAGAFGLSRATTSLVRSAGMHVAIDLGTAREVCNPTRTAQLVLDRIPMAPEDSPRDPQWLADWQSAEAAVIEALRGQIGVGAPRFTGIDAAVITAAAARPDGLMLVAASWPVRHLEAFAKLPPSTTMIGNRGTNGIDGLVATAWGAAAAHQEQGGGPALALLGDLAFLHDHNGLLAPPGEPEPDLTLVVVDNGGGGIFHQLEQARPEFAADFERLFGTPHGLDLAAVSAATGRPTQSAGSAAELAALLLGQTGHGVQVVIARVAPRQVEANRLADLRAMAHAAMIGC